MRNIEKLRDYFLGKDPYLKETMADNSLRLIGIPGKNFVLRTELMKEAQERKTKDDELTKAISDEEEARINADNILDDKFDNYYTKTQIDDKIVDDVESNKSADDKAASVRALYNFVADIVQPLTQDITIPENEEVNPLLLPTGWHTTGDHVVYYGDNIEPVFEENTLFYFSSEHENQWLYVMPPNALDGWEQLCVCLWFDTWDNVWQYAGYDIQTAIGDMSMDWSIPTAAAVYEFVKEATTQVYNPANSTEHIGTLNPGTYLVPYGVNPYIGTAPGTVLKVDMPGTLIVENNDNVDDTTVKYTLICGQMSYYGTIKKDGSSTINTTTRKIVRQLDLHQYSTTEQVVGTWTDDKPLYEMTISETVAANSFSATNINDADEIFIKYGTGKVSDLIYQLPHIDGINDLMASISVLPTYKKVVLSNQSNSSADIMVVVNYTKTTD